MTKDYFIIALLLSISCFTISCSKDEEKNQDSDAISTIVGDYIYSVIQGNNQSGTYGAHLNEEIQIRVTNIEGITVNKSLSFELSDESGSITRNNYYGSADTLQFTWKLGCFDDVQYLKVIDPNVCGIKLGDCIEKEVFELKANASQETSEGWISPCTPFDLNNGRVMVSDARVYYFGYSNDPLRYSEDLLSFDWKTIESSFDGSSNNSITNHGDIYRNANGSLSIMKRDEDRVVSLDSPFGSYNTVKLVSADNGDLFAAEAYGNIVYRNNGGTTWDTYMDINELLPDFGRRMQALLADGNFIFIVVSDHLIKKNLIDGSVQLIAFSNPTWSFYDDLGDFESQTDGETIVMTDRYNDMHVLDIEFGVSDEIDMNSYARLFKSNGELFLAEGSSYQVWNGSSFVTKTTSFPEGNSYDYTILGIYQGSPLYYHQYENSLLYYRSN